MKSSLSIPAATILLFAGLSSSVQANEKADAGGNPIGEVFREITQSDGYLTQEMHARFWKALNKALNSDPAETKRFWDTMAVKPIIASSAYNYEAAVSSELSLSKRRIIYTPNYVKAKSDLLVAYKGKPSLPKIVKAIGTWEGNVKKFAHRSAKPSSEAMENAHSVLEQQKIAAAGPLYRFNVLRKKAFSKPLVRRKYKTVAVTVSWPGEFTTTLARPNKSLEVGMLANMVGSNAIVKILHYRMGPFNKQKRKHIMRKLATGALKEYGITSPILTFETWRSQQSVIARGSGMHKGKPVEMNVRFLSAPIGVGFVSLYTMVLENAHDTRSIHKRLENAVSFGR